MTLTYKTAKSISLKEAKLDEKWLQDQIHADPTILGLGDAVVVEKERTQVSGGRLDFLLRDPNEKIRYVVEVMLGPLDASHLIRTIEYWDIERRRFPNLEHRAVIVAEDITARFFNVIAILHRSVPLIAVQLNAFTSGSDLFCNFTRILDFTESIEDEEASGETQKGREYWEKANPALISISDKVLSLNQNFKATYNQGHIAVRMSGNNFMWFHPRRKANLYWEIDVSPEVRDAWLEKLETAGLYPNGRKNDQIGVPLSLEDVSKHADLIKGLINDGDRYSKR
jgi:hypothetical protein